MEKVYLYQFNIRTKEIKITECLLKSICKFNEARYLIQIIKNNHFYRMFRNIKDINISNVERQGLFISGVYVENDRIDEFKEECIKQLMLYREKLQNDIKSALRLLRECDDAFGGLE